MVRILVSMTLKDAEHCDYCSLLRVPNNPLMKLGVGGWVMCLKGYHSMSEAVDKKASENAGHLVIKRPKLCCRENELIRPGTK